MNTISNLILKLLKLRMEALIDLDSREDLSEELRDMWGAEKVGSGWCGPHLKVCAPTTQCFDFFNRSYNTEPRNTELMANVGVGQIEGSPCMSRSCCGSGRGVPGMHAPDPYRSVYSIFYSTCGSSYYNGLHHDQRFIFDLRDAHFPPQQYERKLVQATKVREYTLHTLSWKGQRNTREQIEPKLIVVLTRISSKHSVRGGQ